MEKMKKEWKGDIVIPVMGATGTGKSNFINTLIGKQEARIGHNLDIETRTLQQFSLPIPQKFSHLQHRRLVIVDTPGCYYQGVSDQEILWQISAWMASTYAKDMKITGFIYLYDISQRRLHSSALQNTEIFRRLCGEDAMSGVVLVTTKWDLVREEDGITREESYRNGLWKDLISAGSTVNRFDGKQDSASKVIDQILCKFQNPHDVHTPRIQTGLADLDHHIPETRNPRLKLLNPSEPRRIRSTTAMVEAIHIPEIKLLEPQTAKSTTAKIDPVHHIPEPRASRDPDLPNLLEPRRIRSTTAMVEPVHIPEIKPLEPNTVKSMTGIPEPVSHIREARVSQDPSPKLSEPQIVKSTTAVINPVHHIPQTRASRDPGLPKLSEPQIVKSTTVVINPVHHIPETRASRDPGLPELSEPQIVKSTTAVIDPIRHIPETKASHDPGLPKLWKPQIVKSTTVIIDPVRHIPEIKPQIKSTTAIVDPVRHIPEARASRNPGLPKLSEPQTIKSTTAIGDPVRHIPDTRASRYPHLKLPDASTPYMIKSTTSVVESVSHITEPRVSCKLPEPQMTKSTIPMAEPIRHIPEPTVGQDPHPKISGASRSENKRSTAANLSAEDKKMGKTAKKRLARWLKKDDEVPRSGMPGDLVILVMGATGTGKSTFVNTFIGKQEARVGHNFDTGTRTLQQFSLPIPQFFPELQRRHLIIVDTPGFDDLNLPDQEILRRISAWLAYAYIKDMKIAGIIYLYDISQPRLHPSALRNIEIFRRLCGEDALAGVVLVTTKWNLVREEDGIAREESYRNGLWKDLISAGSTVKRFDGTQDCASGLVNEILRKFQNTHIVDTLQIQTELVDLVRLIQETSAGRALHLKLSDLYGLQKKRSITANPSDEDKKRTEELMKQVEDLNIPILRRISLFFGL